jgi:hypothetical protein
LLILFFSSPTALSFFLSFPPSRVFLTDVPGVFTKPPSQPGAQLIPEILVAADGSCQLPQMSTAEHDVTGGIEEKLKTAIAVVKKGIPVYIVQVGTPHAQEGEKNERLRAFETNNEESLCYLFVKMSPPLSLSCCFISQRYVAGSRRFAPYFA